MAYMQRGNLQMRRPARVRACAQPSSGDRPGAHKGDAARARAAQRPAEALIHTLADVHKASGRASSSLHMVLGIDNSEDAWRHLDRKVNTYPSLREFTAIGSGGSSFRQSMVNAVQAVVGPVECVTQRCSTGGRYISVTVGPVLVSSADSVLEVYQRMKSDSRLRYFL